MDIREVFFTFQIDLDIRWIFHIPMLDTLKLSISLSKTQYKRIRAIADQSDRWQWVLAHQRTGELLFRRVSGLAETDQNSYHRELKWDLPHTYSEDAALTFEFSVPKYWYGHNIHLLYDFVKALQHFKQNLEAQFNLKRNKLPDVKSWRVDRVDCCYAWRFDSQGLAQQYLDSLKRLRYPRKQPVHYSTAIVFVGNTYSLKLYLKHPEFRKHDMKELIKQGASLEWINHLESKAEGVLRCEATLRKRYLRRSGITTIADLVEPIQVLKWDDEVAKHPDFHPYLALMAITMLLCDEQEVRSGVLSPLNSPKEHPLIDGQYYTAPKMKLRLDTTGGEPESTDYYHPGGGFTFRKQDRLAWILQGFLAKYVGTNAGMQKVDEVQAKLMEHYKPVKAARLVSFWLYVQQFGAEAAREAFGKRNYYYCRSDLKKAGVSLINLPTKVTVLNQDFLRKFRLEVPSDYVTNKVDDDRNIDNVLNFVPKVSGRY